MQEYVLSNPEFLRNKVLKGLALALGVFALLLAFFNIYLQNYTLAGVEILLSLSCWFVFRRIQDHYITYRQTLIVPYFFVLIVVYGSYSTPLSNGLILWSFTFPTIFYLLFGLKHGFNASLIIVSFQVLNILNKDNLELYSTVNISINFLLAYVSVWVVSHLYEKNRENAQDALRNIAMRDPLTGAYNRLGLKTFFNKKLNHDVFSIVLMDIDFFKQVNDKYGHEAGDRVLISLVKELNNLFQDDQIFRVGGEEFILLISEPKESALKLTENLRQKIQKHTVDFKANSLTITISAGISESETGKSLSVMLREADEYLYKAKHEGRNKVF